MTSPYEENVTLEEGDAAPDFTLPAHPAGSVSLADFRGKKNVILAFYPKDDTPGCTREMCGFSDDLSKFQSAETSVFGVSCDSLESHEAFAKAHGLSVPLLADTSRTAGKSYGAVRGDRYMADRLLFVIDKQGIIRHKHAGMPDIGEILEIVQKLG